MTPPSTADWTPCLWCRGVGHLSPRNPLIRQSDYGRTCPECDGTGLAPSPGSARVADDAAHLMRGDDG